MNRVLLIIGNESMQILRMETEIQNSEFSVSARAYPYAANFHSFYLTRNFMKRYVSTLSQVMYVRYMVHGSELSRPWSCVYMCCTYLSVHHLCDDDA